MSAVHEVPKAAQAPPECGMARPSISTAGSRLRVVEGMKTWAARSRSAGASALSSMVYPGTWISCSNSSRVTPGRQPELSGGGHAAFVQEDGFVEAAVLRHFEPSQVHGPRQDLGAGELAGRIARVWRVAEPHPAAPFLGGGGERDQVAGAAHARPLPHAAGIADHHDAQGGVERLVGLHQFEQLAADQFRVGRERHAQRCGVLAHAGPVALEGKKHAVDHADGAEDAPAGEQPYLSRREQLIGGIPDFFIVENETVHKTSFYRRGTGLLACPTGDTLAWCCCLRSFYWPPTHMMW